MKVQHSLVALTRARLVEFIRQPEAVFWVFAFPIVLAMALGFAFRESEPEPIPVGVVAGTSQLIVDAIDESPALLLRELSANDAAEALRTGRISLLVEPGEAASDLRYHLDPTRPDARIARLEVNDAIQRASGRQDVVVTDDTLVEETGSRYIDFLIPGLLGMNLMGTGMWGIGFSVATARMQKLLKRLLATPMKQWQYFLSYMLSRMTFLILEVVAIVLFGWLVFDVAVRGPIGVFAIVSIVGAFTFSGLGILVASRAQTIQGVSGLMNLVMVPMWILSGVFFSSERFPDWAQPFIQVLPLTALNDSLRAVMIESQGLAHVLPDLGIMLVWLIVSSVIGLKIFRWQ